MYVFMNFPMQAFTHKILETETKVSLTNLNLLDSTDIFQSLELYNFENAQRISCCGIVLKRGWGVQICEQGTAFSLERVIFPVNLFGERPIKNRN